jgi:asparagine synthase (glutamine-hydrolysing)
MDEPYQSQSAYLGYHVFGLASQNKVKVLLNGQGADEYLSGYEEFRMLRWFKMFKKFKWIALSKEFHFYYGLNLKSWITQISKYFSYFFPDNWFEFFSKRSKHYRNYAKIINPLKFQPSFKHPFKSYNTKRKHHKGLILHQLYCSPLPRFLRWEDRNSMAHSIEARVPFLYKPLVNLSLSLPLEYLDGVNQTKKLMVESLRNLLPPAIYARKDKKGFITPEEQWVKEDKQGVFEQLFEEKIGFLDDLIHREATLNYYKTLKSGEIPFDYLYWRLILLGWWVEIFNVEIDK